jgi:hypothetical protein
MRLLMILILFLPFMSFGSPDSQEVLSGNSMLKQIFEENKVEAEQGNADAQYSLAMKYVNGWGVPKDEKEAVKWLRLAGEQGHDVAQFTVSSMYADGQGVPKDEKEAVKWMRLAAEQGFASAQLSLGAKYYLGTGVPKDNVPAYMWANIAGANGLDVKELIGIITGYMSQADIAKAQELTRQYIKFNPDVY